MTLTLATARHAIDKHSQVLRIVEHVDDLTDRSVTRDEAEDIGEYDPRFRPCIVVTTAREALEAAWELAYETNRIPAHTPFIFRTSDPCIHTAKGQPRDIYVENGRSRLIDPPAPDPEPWEQSRYCQADGDIYKRLWNASTDYWMCPGDETAYRREDLAKLNPRPLDLE